MQTVLVLAVMLATGGPPVRPASVTVDTSRVVDVKAWARQGGRLVEQWYPKIVEILGLAPEKPPAIRLVFEPMEGVAGTVGGTIHINTDWIMRHPDDRGMIIHELVHVVQAYPKYDPSWLVEGVADYIRWWRFEPKPVGVPRSLSHASYRDSYRTAGAFIAYVESRHPGTVKGLHAALRGGVYSDSLFKELTGSALDDLWSAFVREWDAGTAMPEQSKLR